MKKYYIFIIFLLFIFVGKYMGVFNPKSIEINNLKIDTPIGYYIWSAYQDFDEIDISCGYDIGCHKKILSSSKNIDSSNVGITTTIIYKSFFPSDILSITVSDWNNIKLQMEELKHIFLKDQIDIQINSCLIKKDTNITLDEKNIRYYIIYDNGNLKGIDIIASNKELGEIILNELCKG